MMKKSVPIPIAEMNKLNFRPKVSTRKKMKMESEAQMEIREMGYGDADILQHPFGYVSCGS